MSCLPYMYIFIHPPLATQQQIPGRHPSLATSCRSRRGTPWARLERVQSRMVSLATQSLQIPGKHPVGPFSSECIAGWDRYLLYGAKTCDSLGT